MIDYNDLDKRIAEVVAARRKPIINKIIVGVVVITGIILIGEVAFAEELEESLRAYVNDPSLDFLGHEFEKILFKEPHEAFKGMELNDAEFVAKLKFVIEDIKTMPLQAKAYHKIFTNKINAIAYGSLGGLWGLKVGLGGEEFGKVMVNIIKLGIK